MNHLASTLVEKYGTVASAFKVFEERTRGTVSFADFAYALTDKLKLNYDRDIILQIFTYMDRD